MTNGINFYSKVDYILEFMNKRSSVCVWEVCQLAARGSRRRDVRGFFIPRCQLVPCNGSDHARCMQQQCRPPRCSV